MKIHYILLSFILFACENKISSTIEDTPDQNSENIRGVYKLISLQAQDDTTFEAMEGIEIIKIFTDSQWISPAYLNKNNKVVNTAGGTYRYKNGIMKEVLLYHSKDTLNKGLTTTYKVELKNDTLYQSGIFKAGTLEEWKIEEYWIKIE